MGIFERLGRVIKSYLIDEDADGSGRKSESDYFEDNDLKTAFSELDDYLSDSPHERRKNTHHDYSKKTHARSWYTAEQTAPETLVEDFAELELPFGASADECKTAYKRLLKIHHPDRHAGNSENMSKATEKSARINAAYDRIARWRQSGQTEAAP
ncbi:MAG: J domain-containing protein [Spirochaetaceae bacterium]|jgi:DnaJ-domain-containing protein 1|nr:J domain-containing protein [Spirochaetaceae bacterium]